MEQSSYANTITSSSSRGGESWDSASYHLQFILWLMVMVEHGMFGYSKIDLFTIEGWQSGVFFFSHDHPHMCWQTRIRLG